MLRLAGGVMANPDTRDVWRNGYSVTLSPTQFALFLRIARAQFGVSASLLFDHLYAADPDGGPISGERLVHSVRCHINTALKPLGIEIVSNGRAGYSLKTKE